MSSTMSLLLAYG